MQGTWTRPSIGSQVRPSECSIPISAAWRICEGVPATLLVEREPTGESSFAHRPCRLRNQLLPSTTPLRPRPCTCFRSLAIAFDAERNETHPPSAAEIVAPRLYNIPTAAPRSARDPEGEETGRTSSSEQERLDVSLRIVRNEFDHVLRRSKLSSVRRIPRREKRTFNTAGMTPAAPFVGAVTTLPPPALTSFTAIACDSSAPPNSKEAEEQTHIAAQEIDPREDRVLPRRRRQLMLEISHRQRCPLCYSALRRDVSLVGRRGGEAIFD